MGFSLAYRGASFSLPPWASARGPADSGTARQHDEIARQNLQVESPAFPETIFAPK